VKPPDVKPPDDVIEDDVIEDDVIEDDVIEDDVIEDDVIEDDDVVIVEMPKPQHHGEILGDVECIGSVGSNTASEYPHPRYCCTTFPFAIHGVGNIDACALCYCYCCDILASQCTTWSTHCNAQHDHAWTSVRHELKRKRNEVFKKAT
jgi:hypothetical protein